VSWKDYKKLFHTDQGIALSREETENLIKALADLILESAECDHMQKNALLNITGAMWEEVQVNIKIFYC